MDDPLDARRFGATLGCESWSFYTQVVNMSAKRLLSIILAAVGSVLLAPLAWADEPASPVDVVALRCEYQVNPLGIDARRPRLSWQLRGERRGVSQTAYQILAGDSIASLDSGNLWDSGKVASNDSVHVLYDGRPLTSRQRVYWKVRIWDERGEPSAWSTPAWWEMGLLDESDWLGAWLAAPFEDQEGALYFRRVYNLPQQIKNARAYISGLGYYELFINGRRVGDHRLEPGYTAYDHRALYNTYDVSDCFRQGANEVRVVLGNGWFNMFTECVWGFQNAPWRKTPRFILQIHYEQTDGCQPHPLTSDGTWKVSRGPITFNCIRNGEVYDARLEGPGLTEVEYGELNWPSVKVVGWPTKNLVAQQMPPIRVTEEIVPVNVSEPKPGVFVFDLGQNIAGWSRLSVKAPAGSKIDLKYGERLTPEGLVDQAEIAKYVKHPRFQWDTYICKGKSRESFEPHFVYHGYRYVEVTGLPEKPGTDTLIGLVAHTDFENTGHFECSDEMLNRIQQNTLWSYRGNFHGIPTDCPHREKNGWTGDAHLAAECGMFNFFNLPAYEKWIDDFSDARRGPESGVYPGIVPSSGWGYEWGNGPAWDCAYLLIPYQLYQYYGDLRLIEKHYPAMRDYVDFLTSREQEGLLHFGLGDWVPFKTETPNTNTSTAYYYIDARLVSYFAGLLGKKDDAQKYAELAERIKDNYNKKLYDAEKGCYAPGSQTAQACAIFQGLVKPEEKQRVLDYLIADIESKDNHLDTGVMGAKYLLHVLSENGHTELAYKLATQKAPPSWGYWIEQGATTLWEDWMGTASLNHIFFGDISAWFYSCLAGLRPMQAMPAFEQFEIRPHPIPGLDWVKMRYDSIRGPIAVSWKQNRGAFHLDCTIPANSRATLLLPGPEGAGVIEGDRPIAELDSVQNLGRRDGRFVISVGSGEYKFTVFSQP